MLYVTCQIEALCKRNPDRAIILRYEDLVESPDTTLHNLLEFLVKNTNPKCLIAVWPVRANLDLGHKSYSSKEVHSASIDRWRTLPDFQVSSLAPHLNPMLAQFNYPLLSTLGNVDIEYSRSITYVTSHSLHADSDSLYRAKILPSPRPAQHPFALYNLGHLARSNTSFTHRLKLDNTPSEKILRNRATPLTQLTAVMLALLRRVSENEELLIGVSVSDTSSSESTRIIPIKIANIDGTDSQISITPSNLALPWTAGQSRTTLRQE